MSFQGWISRHCVGAVEKGEFRGDGSSCRHPFRFDASSLIDCNFFLTWTRR